MIDFTDMVVANQVLHCAADAYASPLPSELVEQPCSCCGTACPAGEPDECDRADCPLEGGSNA